MLVILGLVLTLCGLALVANGVLAATGRLTRNHYFLAKRPAAMQAGDGWPAALRAAGPTIVAAGVVSLAAGVAIAVTEPSDSLALVVVGAALLGTLALASIGGLKAQRAARAATRATS